MRAGRPARWTDEELKRAGELIKDHTATEVAKAFNTTRNAILGILYREKKRNGYVPSPDSKYTKPRPRSRFKSNPSLGERSCNICKKTFTKSGHFDLFCSQCRKTGRVI